jgi:protein SCO1/2
VLVLLSVFEVLTLTWAVPMPKDHEGFFDPTILKIEEEKYLGKQVADVEFTDEQGRTHKLLDYIKGHPTALILGYYTCDSACPLIIKNAIEASKNISKDYKGIVLSFDKEDTLKDLQEFKKKLGISPSSRWTFGMKLSQSLGYRFFYSRQDRVFVHPNVVIFIDPEGKISR